MSRDVYTPEERTARALERIADVMESSPLFADVPISAHPEAPAPLQDQPISQELLESLRKIASHPCPCEPVGKCLVLSEGGKDLRCASCIARAAIAKAEGR